MTAKGRGTDKRSRKRPADESRAHLWLLVTNGFLNLLATILTLLHSVVGHAVPPPQGCTGQRALVDMRSRGRSVPMPPARVRLSGDRSPQRYLRHAAALGGVVISAAMGVAGFSSDEAWARPVFRLSMVSSSIVSPNSQMIFYMSVVNVGDEATSIDDPNDPNDTGNSDNCVVGAPAPARSDLCVQLDVDLPPGITALGAFGGGLSCAGAGTSRLTCTNPGNTGSFAVRRPDTVLVIAEVADGLSGPLRASARMFGGRAALADGQACASIETPPPALPPCAVTSDPMTVSLIAPSFGIDAFDGEVTADAAGNPITQAGGHPFDASTSMDFKNARDPERGDLWPPEAIKDVLVELPPGLVGNPTVLDTCTIPELGSGGSVVARPVCSPSSQVGTTVVRTDNGATLGPLPVFNMTPPADVPARFAFNVLGSIVTLDAELRSGSDYGLSVNARNIPEAIGIAGTTVTFWGVPAHPVHTPERACAGESPPIVSGISCAAGVPSKAFLRNPTACTAPGVGLLTTLRADSWQNPGVFRTSSFESHLPLGYPFPRDEWGAPQGPDGCARVPFEPRFDAAPMAGSKAGSPSGFAFDLTLPQSDDPESIGTSDLKKAVVTLPEGVRVAPGSADGLAACNSAQIALRSSGEPTCPDASKIGSLTIDTPLLDEQLTGGIYLAKPFDNPFNSLIAVYLVARGPGLTIKLPGHVVPNSDRNGQLTATFDDNPQLPFERLHLEFKSGPRAPLVTPKRCGVHTTRYELTSWSGKTVPGESSFTVSEDAKGRPCPETFAPGFNAGTENPVAGDSSTFRLRLTREDQDQELRALTVDMPAGLLGFISKTTLCEGDAARDGTCGEASRIGSVTVGAGAGTNPFYISSGRAYITGPYKGAPFGLSIVVPAVAGPFDLGTVVVRSALYVDRLDATLRVVSDPLPTILQGIPLDVRDVRVAIDKPGFMVNPTSCAAKSIGGLIESIAGAKANVSSRFQVGDCASLPVRPRMTLEVGARGRTGRNASTPFVATLRQTPGQANLRFVQVTLPTTINARLTVINDACTRAEYDSASSRCERARTGTATARTPLLRDALRGSVYFVRNGNPLPDLFVRLRGQVDFDLVGRITIPGSKRLRTTFDRVPDVPITSFALRLVAGRDGSIGTTTNLCSRRGRTAKAELDFRGQNGKVVQVDQRLKIKGCGRAARARRGGRSRRGRR